MLSCSVPRIRTLPALFASVLLAGAALMGCSPDAENSQAAPNVEADGSTGETTAEGFPVTVTFAPHDPVTIEDRPERIVSLSPTTTEILFAVGAGEQVVAADEYSNYPEEAPTVDGLSGYTPNVEAVLEYDPDLVVLMTKGEGIVDGLNAANVPVLVVDAAVTIADTYDQIETLGEATDHAEAGVEVVEGMKTDIEAAIDSVPPAIKNAGLNYYHELTSDYYSVSGETYIGQIYSEFGLTSIAPSNDDYPQLTSEAVVAANPDIIFLANTKAESTNLESVASRPGWSTITAVAEERVINLDDDLASRWGPRVSQLVEQIAVHLNEQVSTDGTNVPGDVVPEATPAS